MHQGTYLDTTNNRPIRLGIVVALHVGALAAIMLAPAELIPIPKVFKPLIVDQLPDPTPPPPESMKPRTKLPETVPTTPIPETHQTEPDATKVLPTFPEPPGNSGTTKVEPVPIPNPIFVDATIDPRAAGRVQPDYPSALARAEIEGMVTVKVLIGADGRVKAVEQIVATDPAFFKATEKQALRYWRFKPATRDGVAVESWKTMTVRFRLQS